MLDAHSHTAFGRQVVRNVYPADFDSFVEQYPHQPLSVGVHPWYVDTAWEDWRRRLPSFARHVNVWAIGETGLDKKCTVDFSLQRKVFINHVELAEQCCKPLIIHCVGAYNELVGLKKTCNPAQKWILHGFRGNPELAEQLLGQGFYFSIGYRFNAEAVRRLPAESIYVETDECGCGIEEIVAKLRRESIAVLDRNRF